MTGVRENAFEPVYAGYTVAAAASGACPVRHPPRQKSGKPGHNLCVAYRCTLQRPGSTNVFIIRSVCPCDSLREMSAASKSFLVVTFALSSLRRRCFLSSDQVSRLPKEGDASQANSDGGTTVDGVENDGPSVSDSCAALRR